MKTPLTTTTLAAICDNAMQATIMVIFGSILVYVSSLIGEPSFFQPIGDWWQEQPTWVRYAIGMGFFWLVLFWAHWQDHKKLAREKEFIDIQNALEEGRWVPFSRLHPECGRKVEILHSGYFKEGGTEITVDKWDSYRSACINHEDGITGFDEYQMGLLGATHWRYVSDTHNNNSPEIDYD